MKHTMITALLMTAATATPLALAQDTPKRSHEHHNHRHADQPTGMPAELMEYMHAAAAAGTPGKMHKRLAKAVGTWDAKTKMWFMPGMDPVESTGVAVLSSVYDDRYLKCEMEGDLPGMGRYEGFGLYGFDNVSESFQAIWISNMSTGIMFGTGELSADGKVLTWDFTFNCPVTGGPTWLREVERHIDDNTMVLEMYGPDLEGNEFKMMESRYTRRLDKVGAEAETADDAPVASD